MIWPIPIFRIVEVAGEFLPFVVGISLPRACVFDVQLFDGKTVFAGDGDMVGVAHGAYPVEA